MDINFRVVFVYSSYWFGSEREDFVKSFFFAFRVFFLLLLLHNVRCALSFKTVAPLTGSRSGVSHFTRKESICSFKCWPKCYMSCWRAENQQHNEKHEFTLYGEKVLRAIGFHHPFSFLLFYISFQHYFIKLKLGQRLRMASDGEICDCTPKTVWYDRTYRWNNVNREMAQFANFPFFHFTA